MSHLLYKSTEYFSIKISINNHHSKLGTAHHLMWSQSCLKSASRAIIPDTVNKVGQRR